MSIVPRNLGVAFMRLGLVEIDLLLLKSQSRRTAPETLVAAGADYCVDGCCDNLDYVRKLISGKD